MATINFRTNDDLKAQLLREAKEAGYQTLSDYMLAVVEGRHGKALGKGKQQRVVSAGKSVMVRTRLSAEEKAKFDEIKFAENVSESFLLLRQVRILITQEPHFSKSELDELRNSNRQLTAIGRNLNRVVQQINTGVITDSKLSERYIEQILVRIDSVHAAVLALASKTIKRTV